MFTHAGNQLWLQLMVLNGKWIFFQIKKIHLIYLKVIRVSRITPNNFDRITHVFTE